MTITKKSPKTDRFQPDIAAEPSARPITKPARQTLTASVIIPVFNGRRTLPACLAALQNQTHPPKEIIVVDDGSTDGTAALAAQFNVTVIRQTNQGPAAARNYGAQNAGGDILLFTDADCTPTPNWVAHMLAPFADPTVAGAKGRYRTHQPELIARFVQQEYQERYDRMAGLSQIDFIDTYSAAYRRQLFIKNGGFDPHFELNEDQEFSFRLARQGYRLLYLPARHNRSPLLATKILDWVLESVGHPSPSG